MSDLISRCELFNRLATIPAPPEANELKAQIYAAIQSMESVDAVSVVRCKECKYWRNTDAEKIPTASIACGNMHPDDFCSYGERSEP